VIPNTIPGVWPNDISDQRLASRVHAVPVGCRVAILGLPDDTGVRLNGGRPGAAKGPQAFRDAMARYGVATPDGPEYPKIYDAGDVVPAPGHDAASLAETHRRVSEAAQALVTAGLFPIAIGGGHDLTFAFVRGVIAALGPLNGIYFDAHLDVREGVGSGMPFRRLIEDCGVRTLHLHGFNPLVNTKAHLEWFKAHGGSVRNATPRAGEAGEEWYGDDLPPGDLFMSFDMDVLDASAAPGVSALNPAGWSVHRAVDWMSAAGLSPRVKCLDIMELNPAVDHSGQTARVAVHLVLMFLRSLARRRE
jgi:formimidoylglutamase